VAAARSNINHTDLMAKVCTLAKARECEKRKETVDRAKANKAKFIPLVFEAREVGHYNSHFQYYKKTVSVALALKFSR
jgi:hypothetical protein